MRLCITTVSFALMGNVLNNSLLIKLKQMKKIRKTDMDVSEYANSAFLLDISMNTDYDTYNEL